jgi:hypothetical protein
VPRGGTHADAPADEHTSRALISSRARRGHRRDGPRKPPDDKRIGGTTRSSAIGTTVAHLEGAPDGSAVLASGTGGCLERRVLDLAGGNGQGDDE